MPQIKFLNKFVLANILKNFRWLKIRLHDSKLKHFKCPRCYSLSLRYSIYKVQTRCFALADSLFILAHSEAFVKNFFQVFSIFSEVFRLLVAFLSNFAMLAHPKSFVKKFFQILSNFFRICCSLGVTRRRLAYISTQAAICQALFSNYF